MAITKGRFPARPSWLELHRPKPETIATYTPRADDARLKERGAQDARKRLLESQRNAVLEKRRQPEPYKPVNYSRGIPRPS
jgi:hypothetical protein